MSVQKQQTKNRKGQYLNIKMWFGGAKQSCSVTTLKSLIRNMINGTISVSISFKVRSPTVAAKGLSFCLSFNLLIIINMVYRATDTR